MAGPPFGAVADMHDVGVDVAVNHESALEDCVQATQDLGLFGWVMSAVPPHIEGGISNVTYGFGHVSVARYGCLYFGFRAFHR